MRSLASVIIALLAATLAGCRPAATVTSLPVTRTVMVHDTTVIWRTDSVTLMPMERSSAILPPQDSSHLETSLAESDAWTDSLGLLHHTICNLMAAQSVRSHVETCSTVVLTDTVLVPYAVTVEREVERQLTQWQRIQLAAGRLVLAAAALAVAVILIRSFLS